MAVNHKLTVRYYLRMLAWVFLLYVVWCFAPMLYAAAHFRIDVFQAVTQGTAASQTPEQIRDTLLFKADLLKLPLVPEDLDVSVDESGHRLYAHYSYEQTVRCFRQSVTLDFSGISSAETVVSFKKGSPTGN
jgi:hypothetical protein